MITDKHMATRLEIVQAPLQEGHGCDCRVSWLRGAVKKESMQVKFFSLGVRTGCAVLMRTTTDENHVEPLRVLH